MSKQPKVRCAETDPKDPADKPVSLEEARRQLAESLAKMIVRDHQNRLAAEGASAARPREE
jgi:hypothetical protein